MKKFVVKYEMEDDVWVAVETAKEIFDRMDMDDYCDIHITDIRQFDADNFCEPCEFHGSWHSWHDPLRMEIVRKRDGEVVAVGYGTDH